MRALPVLLLVVATSGACRGKGTNGGASAEGQSAGADDPRDYVGKDALVDQATLVFIDAAERERFERARACLAERGRGWEHYPLRKIGNFVEEDWCRGKGAELGCSGGGFRDQADVDWASVGTLHYPQDWPQVFGVQVSAGHRPAGNGWGVWTSVSTNGKSILGDGGSVGFGQAGDEEGEFYVGTSYAWEIAESRFSEAGEGDGWQLLDRVRRSPEALRDETLARWGALEAKVIAALERNEVLECVYGEYKNDGIPPPCLRQVPISAEKNAAELARIRGKLAGIRAAFDAHGKELHAALLELAPVECF